MSSPSQLDFATDSTESEYSFSLKASGGDCEVPPRKIFSCKRCPYSTDRKNNLKRHMTAMHEVTTQKLECCGVRFLNKADLKTHNGKFHTEGYKCPVCGQHFVRKALLERHFSVHTGEKKFACECGYRTSHKSNLERHYKTHMKESCIKDPFNHQRNLETGFRHATDKSFHPGVRDAANFSSFSRSMKKVSLLHSNTTIQSSEGNLPHYPPSLPFYSGVARSSGLVNPYNHKVPANENVSCVKRKLNENGSSKTSKRGFTVEEILTSDDVGRSGFSNGYSDRRGMNPVSTTQHPHTIQPCFSGMVNPIGHYPNSSSSFYQQKIPRILKPYPLYRSFVPLSSSSLISSPSTSFLSSSPSSSLMLSSLSSPLSSGALFSSSPSSPFSSTAHLSSGSTSNSTLSSQKLLNRSSTLSSFSIGAILKEKSYTNDSKKFPDFNKQSLDRSMNRNSSERTTDNFVESYQSHEHEEYEHGKKESVLEQERWKREQCIEQKHERWKREQCIDQNHEWWNEDHITEEDQKQWEGVKMSKHQRRRWDEERIREQREQNQLVHQEQEEESNQNQEHNRRQFFDNNTKNNKQKQKNFPSKIFDFSEQNKSGKNLETKIDDFTNYIHKKWRIKNSL